MQCIQRIQWNPAAGTGQIMKMQRQQAVAEAYPEYGILDPETQY